MVENLDEDLHHRIDQVWSNMIAAEAKSSQFMKESQMKQLEGTTFVAYFNPQLDINRFFVSEGTGSNMPNVEQSANNNSNSVEGGDQLFENSLDDALCVFKSAGAGNNILKDNEQQIQFYVDMENETMLTKD